jgi:hypothetical protein
MAISAAFIRITEMLLDDAIDVVHICTPHFEHKNMIPPRLPPGNMCLRKAGGVELHRSRRYR